MAQEQPPRTAVVTGAGRATGIGFEVARQLAQRGMRVLLTARRLEDAEARSAELRAEGLDVVGQALDVTDPASIRAVADAVPVVDVLVNNAAATSVYGEVPSNADIDGALASAAVTLYGPWRVTQAFLPALRRSDHARIVNVSSGAGSHGDAAFGLTSGNPMGPSYAVAKAGLNALTALWAKELAEEGILVNAVGPGFTATFEGGEAMGARPVAEGAASVVWACELSDDGPTGGFFRDGEPVPW